MEFVNTIAKIVHISVALHGGAANKNIGDAFLLAWKFPQAITMEEIKTLSLQPYKTPMVLSNAPLLPSALLDLNFSPFSSSPSHPPAASKLAPARTFSRIALRKDRSHASLLLNQGGSNSLRATVGPISFLARASSLIRSNKVQPTSPDNDVSAHPGPIKSIVPTSSGGGESEALRQLAHMRSSHLKPAAAKEIDEPSDECFEVSHFSHLACCFDLPSVTLFIPIPPDKGDSPPHRRQRPRFLYHHPGLS